jgi:hypothetical protein
VTPTTQGSNWGDIGVQQQEISLIIVHYFHKLTVL